jgi:hypothetical protein
MCEKRQACLFIFFPEDKSVAIIGQVYWLVFHPQGTFPFSQWYVSSCPDLQLLGQLRFIEFPFKLLVKHRISHPYYSASDLNIQRNKTKNPIKGF